MKVNEYLEAIKSLPQTAKVALKSAYIFSRKVPREEQEDLFQELALAVLKARTSDERLAYAIARCDWQDWWRTWYSARIEFCVYDSDAGKESPNCKGCKHKSGNPCGWLAIRQTRKTSLDSVTEDEDGNPVTLGELIIGESEFELKMDGKLDAYRIWNQLPDNIKTIVNHRLLGQALNHQERNTLNYWVKTKGYQLLLN